jgi:uncharacterized membrane protein
MDIYLVVLRLIHIVAGALWVGVGFFSVLILVPTLVRMGSEAGSVFRALGQSGLYRMIFPVTSGLTVLAGILLYARPNASVVFSSAGWIVLSIGALAGIAGAIHGGAFLARQMTDYSQKVASGSAQSADLSALGASLIQHARISLVLLVVALVGMSLARYL